MSDLGFSLSFGFSSVMSNGTFLLTPSLLSFQIHSAAIDTSASAFKYNIIFQNDLFSKYCVEIHNTWPQHMPQDHIEQGQHLNNVIIEVANPEVGNPEGILPFLHKF